MLLNSEFDSAIPIGALMQGWGLDPVQWQQLDGRILTRSAWPYLSPKFPLGKLTATVRTLPQLGSVLASAIATADHFIVGANVPAASVQYSSDGVSWTSATTPASSVNAGLFATPSRLLMASSNTGAGVAATTTLNPGGVWTTTTGGPAAVPAGNYLSKMAYSPTLALVLIASSSVGGATGRHTLADAATAWVARTSASGMGAAVGVCWTGTRFVLIGAGNQTCEYTADAVTYTAGLLAEATSGNQGNIVSDGAGVVVVSGCPSGLQVSKDHGATWQLRQIPGVPPSDTWRVQRAGDRFVVPTALGLAFSLDGETWQLETTPVQSMNVASAVAKKGGTVVQVANSATAYSFAESATEFQLPNLRQVTPAASGNPIPQPAYFIKGA